MEGIRPWQINELALCEALIEDPRKIWSSLDLTQVSGLSAEKTADVLYKLQRLGAVEFFWDPPRPAHPVHPLDAHSPRSRRLVRLTGEGATVIRNQLDAGRPRGVLGTFVWEGWSNAKAVWQAKRREDEWKRSRRT
jgi:hypothetical protein